MRLKELRKARGLTQKKIADELSIYQQLYQRYEVGEREPRIDMLIKLADYFDVSVDYLIGHEKTTENYGDDYHEKNTLKALNNMYLIQ